MNSTTVRALRRAFFCASTCAIALGAATAANAQSVERAEEMAFGAGASASPDWVDNTPFSQSPAPEMVENAPAIIIRNDLNPNTAPPTGVLDSGINGVGQMTIRGNPATTALNLCSGTLINPRTVIFAAHCVNTRPMEAYGPNGTTSTPIAFGFNADNLPAVRQWLGLASVAGGTDANPALLHRTNLARALYNVEQVWYDPRSLAVSSNGFLEADVAIATLDTPAFGIPTWAMLFSPLSGPTHAIVTGYGNRANENAPAAGLAIDYRRRAAENMISVLGSFDDRNRWLFGTGSNLNNLYMLSFSDPNRAYNPATGKYDFNIFNDNALPREGTTAGGDSGGPLIVDTRYNRPVVVGVLSGGSRFFAAQQFHNYGTHSFFQPLHLYWDMIVRNNPYVYATAAGGNGSWEDPARWAQMMDPNYFIDVNGQLVNGLPNSPAQGVAAGGAKFGQICFNGDCTTLQGTQAPGTGTILIPGGPGSTGFVPNNVVANPRTGVRARYYDVTLSNAGTTDLSSAATIDRMTLDGAVALDVRGNGRLRVHGEYNQLQGWTHVDGTISTGRDMMLATGLLTGSGTVNTTFLTTGLAMVAPGTRGTLGRLQVQGNVVMSSGSVLSIDIGENRNSDVLAVTTNGFHYPGSANLAGTASFNAVVRPRWNNEYTILTASGGVNGRFGAVGDLPGVLFPTLSYTANAVNARIDAASFMGFVDTRSPTQVALAGLLDANRQQNYSALSSLYYEVDVLEGGSLQQAFENLAPRNALGALGIAEVGTQALGGFFRERTLQLAETLPTGTVEVVTDALSMNLRSGSALTNPNNLLASAASMNAQGDPAGRTMGIELPENVGAFVAAGFLNGRSAAAQSAIAGSDDLNGWFAAVGAEFSPSSTARFGAALSYLDSRFDAAGQQHADGALYQLTGYGTVGLGRLDISGQANIGRFETDSRREVSLGNLNSTVTGSTSGTVYGGELGLGSRVHLGDFVVNPNTSVRYTGIDEGDLREQGGPLAMTVQGGLHQSLQGRAGVDVMGFTETGGTRISPRVSAAYVHEFMDNARAIQVGFAGLGGTVPIVRPGGDRHWAELGAGLRVGGAGFNLDFSAETTLERSDLRHQTYRIGGTFRF